jgi:hypothetical protein
MDNSMFVIIMITLCVYSIIEVALITRVLFILSFPRMSGRSNDEKEGSKKCDDCKYRMKKDLS